MKKFFLFLSMCFAFSSGFATEAPSKDSEIVAFMEVLNKNEIAAADLTEKKKVTKEVKGFADFMLKEHNKNLSDLEKLGKKQKIEPVDSEMVTSLKENGKKELDSLNALDDKAYDTAYMDAMVKGHTEALTHIDSFLKEVTNPKLKTYLKATRVHVKHHLERAEKIKKELK